MSEIHEKEIIMKKAHQELCVFKVDTVKEGLRVFIKSEILENFISRNGNYTDNPSNSVKWSGNEPYKNAQYGGYEFSLNRWNVNELKFDGQPNISFIRAKGLSQGVTFILKFPYSRNEIEYFVTNFPKQIQGFYKEYIKPVHVSVNMSIEVNSN